MSVTIKSKDILEKKFNSTFDTLNNLLKDESFSNCFDSLMNSIFNSYKNGGKLYIAGNGGSAADSQHFAAELVCKLSKDREPIAAEALSTDTSVITSIANDYGYDQIFSRQILCKLNKNDIFLAISTSGKSKNIYNALKICNDLNISNALPTGISKSESKNISKLVLSVPSNDTAVIQEMHSVIIHAMCECIENFIFQNK